MYHLSQKKILYNGFFWKTKLLINELAITKLLQILSLFILLKKVFTFLQTMFYVTFMFVHGLGMCAFFMMDLNVLATLVFLFSIVIVRESLYPVIFFCNDCQVSFYLLVFYGNYLQVKKLF